MFYWQNWPKCGNNPKYWPTYKIPIPFLKELDEYHVQLLSFIDSTYIKKKKKKKTWNADTFL